MKTTVEIPNALLSEARKIMQQQHTTLRALIEEGMRLVIANHQKASSFQLKKATFRGEGLQPDVSTASWEALRGLIYEGRGG